MTVGGTTAYTGVADLPPVVVRAVEMARSMGFDNSCVPGQGRLLAALVAGRPGARVGETGTGCGVGLAWMVEAAGEGTRFVSVEADPARSRAAADLFEGRPEVRLVEGDSRSIGEHGPFDLLVIDGGGSGKHPGDFILDPAELLTEGGTVVIDDFSPRSTWPPQMDGVEDRARLFWLEHPALLSTEVPVWPGVVTIVGTRR